MEQLAVARPQLAHYATELAPEVVRIHAGAGCNLVADEVIEYFGNLESTNVYCVCHLVLLLTEAVDQRGLLLFSPSFCEIHHIFGVSALTVGYLDSEYIPMRDMQGSPSPQPLLHPMRPRLAQPGAPRCDSGLLRTQACCVFLRYDEGT